MITKKGWDQALMLSLFKKEASYNSAVTINSTNFCSMHGYADFDPDWADTLVDDADEVKGSEFINTQEIIEQGLKWNYEEPKARPNSIAGLVGAALGNIVTTQDGALTAYRHKITPVSVGTALPSFNAVAKKGGLQYLYTGNKINTITLSAEAGGPLKLSAEIIGSGSRTTNASSFVSTISEPRLFARDAKIWREAAPNISIDATLTQGTENISSGTPASIGPRVKSWSWKFSNNLEEQRGHGGGGVLADLDYTRRSIELSLTLLVNDSTEIDYYLNQTGLALEIDCKTNQLIAAGGTLYYGVHIIVPRFQLKKAPLPKGGVGDTITQDFDCTIINDGTNPISIVEVYTAKSGYLIP